MNACVSENSMFVGMGVEGGVRAFVCVCVWVDA